MEAGDTGLNFTVSHVYFGLRRARILPMDTVEPGPISLSHASTLRLKVRWVRHPMTGTKCCKAILRAASQPLLIQPIILIHLALNRPGNGIHSLIIVQNPANLAAFCAEFGDGVAADEFDHHKGQLAGQPR